MEVGSHHEHIKAQTRLHELQLSGEKIKERRKEKEKRKRGYLAKSISCNLKTGKLVKENTLMSCEIW